MAVSDQAPDNALEQPTEVLSGGAQGKITLREHPRLSRAVRKGREVAGLLGFALGVWTSLSTHGFAGALFRGVVVGLICELVVGVFAVLAARHLLIAELRAAEAAVRQPREEERLSARRR